MLTYDTGNIVNTENIGITFPVYLRLNQMKNHTKENMTIRGVLAVSSLE